MTTSREAVGPRVLTGAEAVAHAMRQVAPDVVPVYPITPQTPIVQAFSRFVADGRVHTELVTVESEHSAMSAAVGAALAGARTMTATASQGLALMVEVLYIAAGLRAPVVVAVGNRALSAPINIHGDHSDGMLARDSGAVQLYAENAQEAYDLMVMAPRVAEDPEVLLPVLVGQDGFTITHSAEPVTLLSDEAVREFVGPYRIPHPLLDVGRPTTQGPFAMPDAYQEIKQQQVEACERALSVYERVAREYYARSGRLVPAVSPYRLDDAEVALVLMGSAAGTAKDAVDRMRARGRRVGLVQIRLFRPFPREAVRAALRGIPTVAVLDRAVSPGSLPPLFLEVAGSLWGMPVQLRSFVYGLGGRDLPLEAIEEAAATLWEPHGGSVRYLGGKEGLGRAELEGARGA